MSNPFTLAKRKFAIPALGKDGEFNATLLPETEEGEKAVLLVLLKTYNQVIIVETTCVVSRSMELTYESI